MQRLERVATDLGLRPAGTADTSRVAGISLAAVLAAPGFRPDWHAGLAILALVVLALVYVAGYASHRGFADDERAELRRLRADARDHARQAEDRLNTIHELRQALAAERRANLIADAQEWGAGFETPLRHRRGIPDPLADAVERARAARAASDPT
jgi:hypothetical protein